MQTPNALLRCIQILFRTSFVCLWIGMVLGCSHMKSSNPTSESHPGPRPAGMSPKGIQDVIKDSGVEIEYTLGRDHYRFHAISAGDSVTVTSFLNRQILEQGVIDQNRYPTFLQKAESFIHNSQQSSTSPVPCHSPFTVTVRIQKQSETTHGCRAADGGALSKLVRDGEFLLYSKN